MTMPPNKIYAWPSEDFRGWYAASCSDETTLCFDEIIYIRADIAEELARALEGVGYDNISPEAQYVLASYHALTH